MIAKSRLSFPAGSAAPSIQIKLTKTVHFTLIELLVVIAIFTLKKLIFSAIFCQLSTRALS